MGSPGALVGLGEDVRYGFDDCTDERVWSEAEIDALFVVAAIPPGALITAILVVNNVRDMETDRRAGKRTLAVRLGREGAGTLVVPVPVQYDGDEVEQAFAKKAGVTAEGAQALTALRALPPAAIVMLAIPETMAILGFVVAVLILLRGGT